MCCRPTAVVTILSWLCVAACVRAACPPEWVQFGQDCYWFNNFGWKFDQAQEICVNRQANLVSIHSDEENDFIRNVVNVNREAYWIGLRRATGGGSFAWTDGSNPGLDVTRRELWETNCPESCSGDCVQIKATGQRWENTDCGGVRRFVCKRSQDVLDICDVESGWQQFGDMCYKYNTDKRTWYDAVGQCASHDRAQLAVINTSNKFPVLGHVVQCKDYDAGVWIGLSDTDDRTNFKWLGGTALSNTNWANNQPNKPGDPGNNCVNSMPVFGYKWAVSSCDDTNEYLCERPTGSCATLWFSYGTASCYLPVAGTDNHRTWSDAELYCQRFGPTAHLMKITNVREQEALRTMAADLRSSGVNRVFIGVSDRIQDNYYRWADGTVLTYEYWNDWERVPHRIDCGFVDASSSNVNASWSTGYCFTREAFICQIPVHTSPRSLETLGGWLCPDGTEIDHQTGRCYSFSTTDATYDVALQQCSANGMKLLTLNSTEDQSFVSNRLRGTTWIGLEFKGNGVYRWFDGSPLHFENWEKDGQSGADTNSKACVVMRSTPQPGVWTAADCRTPNSYICYQAATHTTAATPSGPTPAWNAECGANWKYSPLEEACYKLNHDQVTFGNAEQLCIAQGGHLASIHNAAEQNFIAAMIMNELGSLNYWIGANDRDQSSGWKWTDGSPFYYWNWNDGEPNNKGDLEFCVELSGDIMSARWNDIECSREFGYICKKPATTATVHPSVQPTKPPVTCDQPSAVVSGVHYVRDLGIYASTSSGNRLPMFARLNNVAAGGNPGSWTADPGDTDRWISVVFTNYMIIAGIQTRGAGDREEWVTEYSIAYRLQTATFYEPLLNSTGQTRIFEGNIDKDSIKEHRFDQLILAHAVRIRIRSFQTAASMRFEILGCRYETCDFQPLVSGDSMVPDVRLTASGSWDQFHTPDRARINSMLEGSYGGGWIANTPWTADQWIQAELDTTMAIYGIQTKGVEDKAQWCTQYKLLYTDDLATAWETYQEPYGTTKIFTGNNDQNTLVTNYLSANIYGVKYIRINPQAWASGGMGLRFEILGCGAHYEGCADIPLLTGSGSYVPNSRLTASSELSSSTGPARSRLNHPASGTLAGAWVPAVNDDQQWIQADLGKMNLILAVATQGRSDATMYVTSYTLSYGNDGVSFQPYPNSSVRIFEGNWDSNRVHKYYLTPTFEARYVRLNPVRWNVSIALRWEIYACAGWATYEIIGCYRDSNDDRDLNGPTGWYPPDGMTLNKCASYCRGLGYLYAGAQFGYECFCGNHYGLYGLSDNCVYQCSGNPAGSTEICGGPNANTVMHTGIYSPDQVVGCYSDTIDRDLPYEALIQVPGGMSQPFCAYHCFSKGYRYAGAQFGEECYCGNTYGRYGPSSRCNMRCGGDRTQFTYCGGDWSNTVISTGLAPDHLGCRAGWTRFGQRCYKFSTERMTWLQAKDSCMLQGSVLATINYQAVNDFMLAQMAILRVELWIGLHSRRSNNYFEWLSEEPVLFTKWVRREPNGATADEKCGMLYQNAFWNDDPCNSEGRKYGYVCMKDLEELQQEERPAVDPTCPPHAQAFRWKCYSLIATQWDWTSARAQCEGLESGSSLVRIEDDYEQAFLASTYIRDAGLYWTDLREVESEFSFTNGQRPPFTNWGAGEPKDDSNNGCVGIEMDDHGKWRNADCSQRAASICQIPRTGWTAPTPTPSNPGDGPCAVGWTQLGSTAFCFKLNTPSPNLRLDWFGARTDCESIGGQLVSIHAREENNQLQLQTMTKSGDFWIGLAVVNDNEGFKWSDGSAVDFENWQNPQQFEQHLAADHQGEAALNAADGKNCVSMYQGTGVWQNIECDSLRNWICKIPKGVQPVVTTTVIPPSAGPAGSCSPDNDEWKFYNGKCYRLSTQHAEVADWWSAEDKCRQAGGHLASIHNADEQLFVQGTLLANLQHFGVWIGLNDINSAGVWSWADESPTDFVHWGAGAPTGEKSLCVAMDGKAGGFGRWIDLHCQTSYPYVCSKYRGGSTITTTPSVPLPGNCPDGYVTYFNKCFRFVEERATWADAHTRCQQMGARPYGLASIADKMEQGFLTSFLISSERTASAYWIGLHQYSGIIGEFGWIDNSPVTFTNWGEYRPSGQADRGCVYMFTEPFRAGQWGDDVCSATLPYVCMRMKDPNAPPQQVNNGPCPENYLLWQGNCYRGLSGSRSWQESENECAKETDGHLTSVANRYEQGFVASRFRDIGAELWIGLTDKQTPGRYTWSDGVSVTFASWSAGFPSSSSGACVSLSRSKYNDWVDGPCESSYGAVCKITKVPASNTRPPTAGGCPTDIIGNNWMEFHEHCYLFRPQARVEFSNASIECQLVGGHLASIHSDDQNDFVFQHMAPNTEQMQWIGMTRAPAGGFLWLDGTTLSYFNWNDGEPNNENEQCVEMYMHNGKWNDVDCQRKNGYVCRRRQVGPSVTPTTSPPILPPGVSTTTGSTTTGPSTTPFSVGTITGTTYRMVQPPGGSNNGGGGAGTPMTSVGVVGVTFGAILLVLLLVISGYVFYMRRTNAAKSGISNPTFSQDSTSA